MENLQNLLLIIHIMIALFIIVLVFLQPSNSGDGLVSSYGGNNSLVSARSAANMLSKLTMFLATLFMINTLALGIIANKQSSANSIVEEILETKEKEIEVPLAE